MQFTALVFGQNGIKMIPFHLVYCLLGLSLLLFHFHPLSPPLTVPVPSRSPLGAVALFVVEEKCSLGPLLVCQKNIH